MLKMFRLRACSGEAAKRFPAHGVPALDRVILALREGLFQASLTHPTHYQIRVTEY